MKKLLRFGSIFLAIVFALESVLTPYTVYAEETSWYFDGEEVPCFVCDDCGTVYDMDEQEPGECAVCGGSETYCDSCYCSTCNRCNEHCICDLSVDEAAEYDSSQLEKPEVPEIDTETISAAISKEITVSDAKAQLELDKNGKYPVETWRLFQPICHLGDESSCMEFMKSNAQVVSYVRNIDSSNVERGISSDAITQRFMKSLKTDAKLQSFFSSKLDWSDGKVSGTKKVQLMKDLVEELKRLAIANGADADYVKMIKVVNRAPETKDAVMELAESDDPDILYEIRLNPDVVKKSDSGYFVAEVVTHEFQHAVNHLYEIQTKEIVNDEWEMTLPKTATAGAIRQVISNTYYTIPDLSLYAQGKEDEYLKGILGYISQLEERTANEASMQLYADHKDGETHAAWHIQEKYGFEVFAVAMKMLNDERFSDEGTSYLDKLAAKVPELAMIECDTQFSAVTEINKNDGYKYLMENGPYNSDLLGRFKDENGTEYILPTKALFDWVTNQTGQAPFDWDEMTQRFFGKTGGANQISKFVVNSSVYKSEWALTIENIPADLIVLLDSIAAGMAMSEGRSEEETAKITAAILAISEELEDLTEQMESFDELESISDELETLADEAESLQGDLESLVSELEGLSEEADALYDELCQELEDYADEINQAIEDMTDNPDEDMSEDDIENYVNDLKSDYESRIEDLQSELDDLGSEMESIADEIEAKNDELESIMDEIESLSSDAESAADELEYMADQAESLAGELETLNSILVDSGAYTYLDVEYQTGVELTITDEEGSPVRGVSVYAAQGAGPQRFVGKTDADGLLECFFDASEYSHWQLSVSYDGQPVQDEDGYFYEPNSLDDLMFVVKVVDGEAYFVLKGEMVLNFAEEEIIPAKEGSFRVTMRMAKTKDSKVRTDKDLIDWKQVSWKEYFDYQFSHDDYYFMEHRVASYWKNSMTEDKRYFYGAYLLELGDGELPRVAGDRYYQPIYTVKNGKPVSLLVESDDYAKATVETVPYSSYGFDFGNVKAGRYELAILLPSGQSLYTEITIVGGQKNYYSAEEWTSSLSSYENSKKVKTMTMTPMVYSLNGAKFCTLFQTAGAVFCYAVDAAGKTLWTVPRETSDGKWEISVPVSEKNAQKGDMEYGERIDGYRGQIYVLQGLSGQRLLPMSYQYSYTKVRTSSKNGEERLSSAFRAAEPGKLYAISTGEGEKLPKLYVAFWEEYYDAEGNAHYKTVRSTVSFDVQVKLPSDAYGDSWAFDTNLRLDDALSSGTRGTVQNFVYSRNFASTGASYTYHYSQRDDDICNGMDIDEIPANKCAEEFSLADSLWPYGSGLGWLTGTAVMNTSEKIDGVRKTTKVAVTAKYYQTGEGTVLRFIFQGACSEKTHDFEVTETTSSCTENGTTVYTCKYCGEQKKAESAPLGHLVVKGTIEATSLQEATDENGAKCLTETKQEIAVKPQEVDLKYHAFVCLRCGEVCEKSKHNWETKEITEKCKTATIKLICTDCGAEKTEEMEAPNGHHNFGEADLREGESAYLQSSTQHWRFCLDCGEEEREDHYFWRLSKDTLECQTCGYLKLLGEQDCVRTFSNYSQLCPHITLEIDISHLDVYYRSVVLSKRYWSLDWYAMVSRQTKYLASDTLTFKLTDQMVSEIRSGAYLDDDIIYRLRLDEDETQLFQFRFNSKTYTVPEKASTCMTHGTASHLVCWCGAHMDKNLKELKTSQYTLPLGDHTFSNDCDAVCNLCGNTREVTHDYSGAWLHYNDFHFKVCQKCGCIGEVGSCIQSQWIVDQEPTCTMTGSKHTECVDCGAVLSEQEIAPAHHFEAQTFTEATCDTVGEASKSCTVCGEKETYVVPVASHVLTWVEEEVPGGSSGGDITDGSTEAESEPDSEQKKAGHYVCTTCGKETLDRKGLQTVEKAPVDDPNEPSTENPGGSDGPTKQGKFALSWWMWLLLILLVLAIAAAVVVIIFVKKKKEEEDSVEETAEASSEVEEEKES